MPDESIAVPATVPDRADRCLSFEVSGPWAHFRRIEGNIVKQTYQIVPRTTVAGLVAAMLGIERDGYYELFGRGDSLVAIEPTVELRTMNLPTNTLSTAASDLTSLKPRGKISIKLPDPTKLRQQHNYEVLVDPSYRIDVWLSETDAYEELRAHLEAGTSHYVPSLGLSEHLAEIDYLGEHDIVRTDTGDTAAIDSAVPGVTERVIPEPGTRCQMEQSPAFMEADETGRTTREFAAYAYSPDGDSLDVRDVSPSAVDGRHVLFV